MTPGRFLAGLFAAALMAMAGAQALAAGPTFPALTGRVVDEAHILPPQTVADLTAKLAALEAQTSRQLVVVTTPSLQGYPIEDYGYQLGRAWGIGQKAGAPGKEADNGVIFLVAPSERAVRIEVGYGLEPVLTDALSSIILQRTVLPRFKAGDMAGGVVAGTGALVTQLGLDEAAARANVAAAQNQTASAGHGSPLTALIILVVVVLVFSRMLGGGGLGMLLPMILMGGRGGGFGGGGFGGGGGGGFGGGGGSFGGGGSSGSW